MSRLYLSSRIDLPAGGYIELIIRDTDPDLFDTTERVLVAALTQALTMHPTPAATAGTRTPQQGGPVDGPDDVAIADPDVEAAAAAEEAAVPGPEDPPATTVGPPRQAAGRHRRRRCDGDMGVALLRALHDLGGEVFDPAGGAASRLFDHAGVTDTGRANARTVLLVLAEAGHVSRSVAGKRTTRVALTASGLAIIDADTPAPDLDADVEVPGPAAAVRELHPARSGLAFDRAPFDPDAARRAAAAAI